MAIQLSSNDIMRRVIPLNKKYFEESEIIDYFGTRNIKPKKVGPLWVIYNMDMIKKKEQISYNLTASEFFKMDIWGRVLLVSALELPEEWGILDDSDKALTPDLVDAATIRTLDTYCQSVGISLLWEGPVDGINLQELKASTNIEIGEFDTNQPKKEVYNYFPKKQSEEARTSKDFKKFLENSLPFILKYKHSVGNPMLIFTDDQIEIKVINEDDKKDTLKQIIEYCLEEEKYEELAEVQKIYDKVVENK